jgi:hypothetical protein
MQRVRCDCGAILTDAIDWCPQCHRPRSATAAQNGPVDVTTPAAPTTSAALNTSTVPNDVAVPDDQLERQLASGLSAAYFVQGRPPEPIARRRRGHPERGRWDATDITFGPFGRVVVTLLATLPFALFLYNLPFGVVGIVCYLTVYPRALRQIWMRADRM